MTLGGFVALRKESVDRNASWMALNRLLRRSLSARRAWIEIFIAITPSNFSNVALRKESVDRNVVGDVMGKGLAGRSPQGERG